MKIYKLKDFTRGWVVGNFDPSLFNTDLEVGIMKHRKGEIGQPHYHKEADEINIVVKGRCLFTFMDYDGKEKEIFDLNPDDIIIVEKNEIVKFQAIQQTTLVVIKTKSVKGDKYILDIK